MNKSEIINLVYKADLSKCSMLVILYLINRADANMTCFPSIKRIAKDCSISSRTVQRVINDLVDAGCLKRESRFHEKGGQRSNYFTILKGEVKIQKVNLFEEAKNRKKEVVEYKQLPKISVFESLKQSLSVILS